MNESDAIVIVKSAVAEAKQMEAHPERYRTSIPKESGSDSWGQTTMNWERAFKDLAQIFTRIEKAVGAL